MADQPAGVARPTRRVVALPLTRARDGYEHLIDGDAVTSGVGGRFTTLCGRAVWAAALACPPGPLCRACIAARDADATVWLQRRRKDRRKIWMLAFLLHKRTLPAEKDGSLNGE
jgi:hypothetical protein